MSVLLTFHLQVVLLLWAASSFKWGLSPHLMVTVLNDRTSLCFRNLPRAVPGEQAGTYSPWEPLVSAEVWVLVGLPLRCSPVRPIKGRGFGPFHGKDQLKH